MKILLGHFSLIKEPPSSSYFIIHNYHLGLCSIYLGGGGTDLKNLGTLTYTWTELLLRNTSKCSLRKCGVGNAGQAAWIYRNQSPCFLVSSNKQNWRCNCHSKSQGLTDWLVSCTFTNNDLDFCQFTMAFLAVKS